MTRLFRYLAVLLLLAASAAHAGKPYQYYAVGDPANVVLPQPRKPSLVLMGGGRRQFRCNPQPRHGCL
jgi:hypothetical protein